MSTCILVTGSPYSGKSILAGTLYHLGIFMGVFDKQDDIYHRSDFYEDNTLVKIDVATTRTRTDEQMLDAAHLCIDDTVFEHNKSHLEIIDKFVENKSKKYNVWGFKDPRLLFPNLMNQYCEIISKYAEIKLICSGRKANDIVSCYSDPNDDLSYIKNAVSYFMLRKQILLEQTNVQKMYIGFEAPLNRPKEFVQSMADFAEVPITDNAFTFVNGRNERAKSDGKP